MMGQALFCGRASGLGKEPTEAGFKSPPCRRQSVGAELALLVTLAQAQGGLEYTLQPARKLGRAAGLHLDHLPATAQQMGQAALVQGLRKLTIDTPAIAHQKPGEIFSQHVGSLLKPASRLD